eukprot:6178709-Pleurochrysis_carterae.AAC.5
MDLGGPGPLHDLRTGADSTACPTHFGLCCCMSQSIDGVPGSGRDQRTKSPPGYAAQSWSRMPPNAASSLLLSPTCGLPQAILRRQGQPLVLRVSMLPQRPADGLEQRVAAALSRTQQ